MESPLSSSENQVGRLRLKSTLPARGRMAWAQIAVEINGVKTNCMPQHGWHANSSFAELAAEPVAK